MFHKLRAATVAITLVGVSLSSILMTPTIAQAAPNVCPGYVQVEARGSYICVHRYYYDVNIGQIVNRTNHNVNYWDFYYAGSGHWLSRLDTLKPGQWITRDPNRLHPVEACNSECPNLP